MNLGELRAIVNTWTDEDFVFLRQSFRKPHSYRGYYNELSFAPADKVETVRTIKEYVDRAESDIFTGWKGGEFTYDESTPVHLTCEGSSYDEDGSLFEIRVKEMNREYQEAHSYNYSFTSDVCYNTSMETKMTVAKPPPRKTAAEKRTEAEALRLHERRLEESKFCNTYQTRLLSLVHVFVREHPHLLGTSLDEAYEFSVNSSRLALPFELTEFETLAHVMEDMTAVEHFVEKQRKARRLKEERAEKRMNALSKFTKEERELLGV
jgi:hypothetical protein